MICNWSILCRTYGGFLVWFANELYPIKALEDKRKGEGKRKKVEEEEEKEKDAEIQEVSPSKVI